VYNVNTGSHRQQSGIPFENSVLSISSLLHRFINIVIANVPVFYSNTAVTQFLLFHLEEEGKKHKSKL
jgi:hypothetical protein